MSSVVHLLVSHGIAMLFVAVLAEQAGLPIPCTTTDWLPVIRRMNSSQPLRA
jgi:hypothetical protein